VNESFLEKATSGDVWFNFLASLKLTVWLLVASMLLIVLGTLEQVNWGVWHVQKAYFSSWGCFFPLNTAASFRLPLPGGFLLGTLLVINLVCAHFRHFKLNLRHAGISLIHGGLVLLLIGGFVTAACQEEAAMVIPEGETRAYTEAFREFEVAVIDRTDRGKEKVVALPDALLRTLTDPKAELELAGSPFKAKVLFYYPNSILRAKSQMPEGADIAATQGIAARSPLALKRLPESFNDNVGNVPSTLLELSANGQSLGTWLLNAQLTESFPAQTFEHAGRQYELSLRRTRTYLPFGVRLDRFTHDKYPGTEIPRRFASDVTIQDTGTPFTFNISMNQPLRHGGMTFYQSSFGNTSAGKDISVLQVVRNPGWLLPYISVSLMSFGLLVHFGVALFGFLQRRTKTVATAGLVALLALSPTDARAAEAWDSREIGTLPVQSGGRIIPLETLATGSLLQMRARRELTLTELEATAFGRKPSTWTDAEKAEITQQFPEISDEIKKQLEKRPVRLKGRTLTAYDWLIEVCFRASVARLLPTFRVDHPVVLKMMGRDPEKTKFVSWDDILKNSKNLTEASGKSRQRAQADRDAEDRALLQLEGAARQYALLSMTFMPGDLPADIAPQREYQAWLGALNRAAEEMQKNRGGATTAPAFDKDLQETLRTLVQRYQDFANDGSIRIVPPKDPTTTVGWDNLGTALLAVINDRAAHRAALAPDGVLTRYALFCVAWRDGDDDSCRDQIRALNASLVGPWTPKANAETTFSRLQPFYWLLIAYVCIVLLVLWAWAASSETPRKWAYAMLLSVFLLHTVALGYRMWLHERPPVTNLYSSGIFVAWGAVLLGVILERLWKNGIGAMAAGLSGFLSLIVAHNLGLSGEDNLESVRAVLDSNFWLSTHVTTVTIGYSATFVAGLIGAIHLWLRAFKSDYKDGDALARAAYGILAFALIASFIGTMLGGIWADQSWGRFWGWDPKENGAVLIVLWCAVCLHARWGGLVRREGLMQLLIFGNIVTAWSWFGTNLLGVGLHSYGFTESGSFWLYYVFCPSQLALIALGWFPARRTSQPSQA
jgi:ABC-type transport system involved in cytochrome c biogenesis permease subunit